MRLSVWYERITSTHMDEVVTTGTYLIMYNESQIESSGIVGKVK